MHYVDAVVIMPRGIPGRCYFVYTFKMIHELTDYISKSVVSEGTSVQRAEDIILHGTVSTASPFSRSNIVLTRFTKGFYREEQPTLTQYNFLMA